MYRRILSIFACLFFYQGICQNTIHLSDSFQISNSLSRINWIGDTGKFFINASSQLQLNDSTKNSPAYLGFLSTVVDSATWEFYFKADFSPSGSNYSNFYLFSNALEFEVKGQAYFVRIGGQSGNLDRVSLFRQDGANSTEIISGRSGTVGNNTVEIKIKVHRSLTSVWSLYADTSKTLQNYILEGQTIDSTYTDAKFSGWNCRYTSTRSDKFFLDNVSVIGYELKDKIAPRIDSHKIDSDSSVCLFFSEVMNNNGTVQLQNQTDSISFTWNSFNTKLQLVFHDKMMDGTRYNLSLSSFTDTSKNQLLDTVYSFVFYQEKRANYREIVINEIMADHSPPQGLPTIEYIELYNASQRYFDLKDWTIEDPSSQVEISHLILAPDSYLILGELGACATLDTFGLCIELEGFPSLNNDADQLILNNQFGEIIDKVAYEKAWYQDPLKNDGGFSLEQINPFAPCVYAENYAASQAALGGSPARINSIFNDAPDSIAPQISKIEILSKNSILFHWNEAIDSSNINMDSAILIPDRSINSLRFNDKRTELLCLFSPALDSGTFFSIRLSGFKDCWSNDSNISIMNQILTFNAPKGAVILNELLFNPHPFAHDFIELYNQSSKWVDLKNWSVARLKDSIVEVKPISSTTLLLQPGAYLLLSEMPEELLAIYPFAEPSAFFKMSSLPSMPNDAGQIVLIDQSGLIHDNFNYYEELHFPLLKDVEGVSLERVDPKKQAQEDNLFSASKKDNYASPGYRNSQYNPAKELQAKVDLENESFSPDHDGYEDRLAISYKMDKPGYLLNLRIFNSQGIEEKYLLNNELLGTSGRLYWDGLNENKEKSRIGVYILYFQFYHPDGSSFNLKKTAVLAGKL